MQAPAGPPQGGQGGGSNHQDPLRTIFVGGIGKEVRGPLRKTPQTPSALSSPPASADDRSLFGWTPQTRSTERLMRPPPSAPL
eukprot:6447512-Pyramimonas_sp.AAC.1